MCDNVHVWIVIHGCAALPIIVGAWLVMDAMAVSGLGKYTLHAPHVHIRTLKTLLPLYMHTSIFLHNSCGLRIGSHKNI